MVIKTNILNSYYRIDQMLGNLLDRNKLSLLPLRAEEGHNLFRLQFQNRHWLTRIQALDHGDRILRKFDLNRESLPRLRRNLEVMEEKVNIRT